jgi:RNA polymerase sigma-70 factor, ECF subfamily
MAERQKLIEALYRDRYAGFRDALAPVAGSRDAAHDVVQEAFACALRKADKLRKDESLAPWIWKIALRIAVRQSGRSLEDELSEDLMCLDEEHDPQLAAAVRSLAPQRRLVLFLRYYDDFSYSDIAAALDIAEGTVAATLSQAHATLLDQLMKQEVAR